MTPSPRIRWLNGRYANVDGIPFHMPVRTQTSPALFAAFAIDPDQAAELLPGQELQPLRILGHGLLVIAVVNYLDTTIGKYVEFCIGVMVTHGTRRAPLFPPWPSGASTGRVSTSTTCRSVPRYQSRAASASGACPSGKPTSTTSSGMRQ